MQLKHVKGAKKLMLMLVFNETIDQLVMANNFHVYIEMYMKVGHVLRRVLQFEVEGRRKKSMPRRAWKRQVEVESTKVY